MEHFGSIMCLIWQETITVQQGWSSKSCITFQVESPIGNGLRQSVHQYGGGLFMYKNSIVNDISRGLYAERVLTTVFSEYSTYYKLAGTQSSVVLTRPYDSLLLLLLKYMIDRIVIQATTSTAHRTGTLFAIYNSTGASFNQSTLTYLFFLPCFDIDLDYKVYTVQWLRN